MDRITGPNYALVGGLRMWADRNPATGTPGTFGNAQWFNAVQEELLNVITAGGQVPTSTSNSQLAYALGGLFGNSGNLARNGYQRLSGGLILQWGVGTTTTGNEDQVFFPAVFPNACFVVNATEGNAQGWGSPPVPTIYGATVPVTNSKSLFLVSAASVPRSGAAPIYSVSSAFNYVAMGN